MATTATATWAQPLAHSIRKNGADRAASWVQLATVTPAGRPAVRTVVHRGVITVAPLSEPVLSFVTDARSGKVQQVAACDWGEAAWYFGVTREQWRIAGRLGVVMAAGHVGFRHPLWTAEALERARRAAWVRMSDAGRAQFAWPHPGRDRAAADADGASFIRSLPLAAGEAGPGTAAEPPAPPAAGDPRHAPDGCGLLDACAAELAPDGSSAGGGAGAGAAPADGAAAAASDEAPPVTDALLLEAAYANFCLLLLQPDSCDWLCLKFAPTQRRAVHELVAGEDGSRSWRVREVNP